MIFSLLAIVRDALIDQRDHSEHDERDPDQLDHGSLP
jgi:hypothetical protein